MITVRVQYYASLREERGCDSETVQTGAATAGGLYDELRKRHGFRLERRHVKAAVNDDIRPWDTRLKHGDGVAFLPPVAGG